MGQAVDLPLQRGPGWYVVMEQGDAMFTREAGEIAPKAGKLPPGTVMMRLDADRVVGGVTQKSGQYVSYEHGANNACILWEGIDARTAGAKRTLTVRDTQVQKSSLSFAFAATDAHMRTAFSLLATNGIIMR